MSKYLLNFTDTYTDFENKQISDFILYNCGIEYCDPSWSYGPKQREYHFIHFVIAGKGTLKIEGHTFPVHKNQCFIVPAGTISTYTADKENPWKYCWIGFLGIQSNRYVEQILQENNFVQNINNAKFYEQQIQNITNLPSNTLASNLEMTGITYQILGSLLKNIPEKKANNSNNIAMQAKRYMDLNYYDDIRIADIAEKLSINSNYLSEKFKLEFNISPKQYLITIKIKKAKKLLTTTSTSITVVANSVGFNDVLSFSKFFKKYTAYSPTQYRKEMTKL